MSSDYDRGLNESRLWTPVLRSQGIDQIELSTDEEDWAEGFDMVGRMPNGEDARFAVRSRKLYPDQPAYYRQFTIRWKRSSGAKTEKDKVLDRADFPEYMCYGFSSNGVLTIWVILSVCVLRRMHKAGQLEAAKAGELPNYDKKRSVFRAFWLPQLVRSDPDLVWKSSPSHPGIPAIPTPTSSRLPLLPRQLKLS